MIPTLDNDVRMGLLRKYGDNSMAYSSLQNGMEFFLEPDVGYVPYSIVQTAVRTPVVLGDPICAATHYVELLSAFMAKYHHPVFIHLRKDTAIVLAKKGLYINEMGVETIIDVQQFSLHGAKKEALRSQKNRALKEGVKVVEMDFTQVRKDRLEQITHEWMNKKAVHDHELSFLVRQAVYEDEPDVRHFYAVKDDQILGFVYFDPIYETEAVTGYLANILRTCSNASYSVTDYIMLEAIDTFKAEGRKMLSLGFSPFSAIADTEEFNFSKPLQELFKYTYEHCNHMYAFKALAAHKSHYRPGTDGTQEVKIYSASTHPLPMLCLYGIFLKMGLHPILQTVDCAVGAAQRSAVDYVNEIIENCPEDCSAAEPWF